MNGKNSTISDCRMSASMKSTKATGHIAENSTGYMERPETSEPWFEAVSWMAAARIDDFDLCQLLHSGINRQPYSRAREMDHAAVARL